MQEHVGLLVKFLLSVLTAAFLAWAGVVWNASGQLSDKFDEMMQEFREYSISTEHRITKLEAEVSKLVEMLEEKEE